MANSDYSIKPQGYGFCPMAYLAENVDELEASVAITGYSSPIEDGIQFGKAALITSTSPTVKQEIVKVVSKTGNVLTIARGCCDTIPQPFSLGDRIWFFDESIAMDPTEYAGTETIGVKVQPRLASGTPVPIEYVDPHGLTFGLRFARPYPPGLVEVNGDPWFDPHTLSSADTPLAITWAHRDRVTQQDQLIDHLQGSVGPEVGTTYEIEIYKGSSLIRTVVGVTGTSWSYDHDDAMTDFFSGAASVGDHEGHLVLRSMRDELESFQQYTIDFTLNIQSGDGGGPSEAAVLNLTVTIPVTPAAATIAMNLTQVAAPQSNGSAYVAIFHCPESLQPDPMPDGVVTRMNFGVGANQAYEILAFLTYTAVGSTSKGDVIDALVEQANASPALSSRGLIANANSWLGVPGLQITGPLGLKLHSAYGVWTPGLIAPVFTALNNLIAQEFDLGSPVVPVDLMQIVTATVTGTPAIGDRFTITLNAVPFSVVALSGATASSIATALAALIDAHASYEAAAIGAVVTIEGVTPVAFSYTASSEAASAYAS